MAEGQLKRLTWGNFAQGMNPDYSPIDSPYLLDVVNLLPVGNMLRSRFGYVQSSTCTESVIVYIYRSTTTQHLFTVSNAGVIRAYAYTLGPFTLGASANVGTIGGGSATYGQVQMCELNGTFVVASAAGIYTCGTTAASLSAVITALPNGGVCAVWQNKVWASAGKRLYFSNAGTGATWTTGTDFVDIVEVDSASITALGAGQSYDVQAQNQLDVFKASSWYRVTNSTNGSYQTMSTSHGAYAPFSVAVLGSKVYFGNVRGVYVKDGASSSTELPMPQNGSVQGIPVIAYNGHIITGTASNLVRYFEYIPETGNWYLQMNTGTITPYIVSAQIPSMWLGETGVIAIGDSNKVVAFPPPVTGAETSNSQTISYLDIGASSMQCYIGLPALSGRGNKIRARRGWVTARAGGTCTVFPKIWRDITANVANNNPAVWRTFPSQTLTSVHETYTQASMGAHTQLMLAFNFNNSSPAGLTTDVLYTTNKLPNLEVLEAGLEFVEIGS